MFYLLEKKKKKKTACGFKSWLENRGVKGKKNDSLPRLQEFFRSLVWVLKCVNCSVVREALSIYEVRAILE